MDGLVDYIKWLGDVDFDAKPFNEVDALIMCVISYFDLSPAMDPNGGVFYLNDCMQTELSGKLGLKITGGDLGNSEIFREAAESKRFGGLVITRYVDQIDPDQDLQFSAVVLSWKDDFSFIAFRGTDDTLVGWKEDFMTAYTQTAAQKLAAAYAKNAINGVTDRKLNRLFGTKGKGRGRTWYIGGHSKGANLAMYAAGKLSKEELAKVERVFVLDGPGFAPEVVGTGLLKRIDAKATRIIPEYSVIGRLMEPKLSDTRIIKSSFEGLMQHSLASWGVDHGGLALSEMTEPKDRWINETLRKWIEGMSGDARRQFVNELFDALMSGGAETVPDLTKGGLEGLEAVMKSFKGFSDSTKEVLVQLRNAALTEIKESTLGGIIDVAKGGASVAIGGASAALEGAGAVLQGAGAVLGDAKKAIGGIIKEAIEKVSEAQEKSEGAPDIQK